MTAFSAVVLFRSEQNVDWNLAIALESISALGAFSSGHLAKLFAP